MEIASVDSLCEVLVTAMSMGGAKAEALRTQVRRAAGIELKRWERPLIFDRRPCDACELDALNRDAWALCRRCAERFRQLSLAHMKGDVRAIFVEAKGEAVVLASHAAKYNVVMQLNGSVKNVDAFLSGIGEHWNDMGPAFQSLLHEWAKTQKKSDPLI